MQISTIKDIKDLAEQLKILKKLHPEKYYECKGRINALYEKETENIVLETKKGQVISS